MEPRHGWVRPLPYGAKARCGGPGMCSICQEELAAMQDKNADDLPPTRLARCPECGGEYWGDGTQPCYGCAHPIPADRVDHR